MGILHRKTLGLAFNRLRRIHKHRHRTGYKRRSYLQLNEHNLSDRQQEGGDTLGEREDGEKEESESTVVIHSAGLDFPGWESEPEPDSNSDNEEDWSDGEDSSETCSELSSSEREDGDRLDKYFDPYTSLLYEGFLDSTTPVRGWEKRMEWRIRHGRGLSAWIDWVVDTGVRFVQRVVGEMT